MIDGAIAAFDAEPVGYFYAEKPGDWYQISDGDKVPDHRRIPLYSSPQSGQVVKLPNEFISNEGIVVQIEKVMAVLAVAGIQYERKGGACRAAMLQGSQPVSNRDALPLDYLQGHKDGLEWAAQLAEANHPQTGDWLYDDPIELAKAIRKGPDMPDGDGNSPATPDCWTPVSERMPERDVDVQVYCADKKEQMVGYMERNEADGWFRFASFPNGGGVYCKPTHWMPLPAAPQQEVLP
ncbi:TPA: DUF551 domain-containing protein [Citrobacter freundii]|nr:DUF551 domain-containing protein [Citrobacter freundii]